MADDVESGAGGHLRVNEAAVAVGLTERHEWRMVETYRREGAAGVAHGNRGRQPENTTAEDVPQQAIELATRGTRGSTTSSDRTPGREGSCSEPIDRTEHPEKC